MKKKDIDLFFKVLDAALGQPAEVIIIGASAGTLMGHVRPSLDIDFEIRPTDEGDLNALDSWDDILKRVSVETKTAINYSTDISHWSMVSFLDYRTTAIPYKKIGQLNIKIIAPMYWTIGKMGRYISTDTDDIVKVIQIKAISVEEQVCVWARALATSQLSLELGQYKSHVLDFLRKQGTRAWGEGFDPEAAIKLFESEYQKSKRVKNS